MPPKLQDEIVKEDHNSWQSRNRRKSYKPKIRSTAEGGVSTTAFGPLMTDSQAHPSGAGVAEADYCQRAGNIYSVEILPLTVKSPRVSSSRIRAMASV